MFSTNSDPIPFDEPKSNVEHVDSTTIVERIEITLALREKFLAAGYIIEVGAVKDEND